MAEMAFNIYKNPQTPKSLHPKSHLLLHALAEGGSCDVHEAVDARCNRALVGEVARDAALVALLGAPDEGAVEDEAILGRVALRLQRAEERLLCPQDLHRARLQPPVIEDVSVGVKWRFSVRHTGWPKCSPRDEYLRPRDQYLNLVESP